MAPPCNVIALTIPQPIPNGRRHAASSHHLRRWNCGPETHRWRWDVQHHVGSPLVGDNCCLCCGLGALRLLRLSCQALDCYPDALFHFNVTL